MEKKAKPGKQYYGAPCKNCKKVFLLPRKPDPNNPVIFVTCDKCGHKNKYFQDEINLYDYYELDQ